MAEIVSLSALPDILYDHLLPEKGRRKQGESEGRAQIFERKTAT